MAKTVSRQKAKEILKDGTVHGRRLTSRQRRFFQARAAGLPVRKTQKHRRKKVSRKKKLKKKHKRKR